MFAPARLAYALRPNAPIGILVAAAAVQVLFGATPFLIPEVASRYGVTEGLAAGISVAQVGAFAIAGRRQPAKKRVDASDCPGSKARAVNVYRRRLVAG